MPSPGTSGGNYTVIIFDGSTALSGLGIATVNNFVVIGGIGGGALTRYGIRWCAIGDATDWPTPATDDARAKQAGEQDFPAGHGWVTAVAGNDFYGYVFQETAISKMTYVGGDVVFAFDTFEEGRGCVRQGRYAQIDDKVFFESQRGFHMLENDIITDIGYGIVDDSRA